MTWLPSGTPSGSVGHPIWHPIGPCRAPCLAPRSASIWPLVEHPVWPPVGHPSGTPSGTMIWNCTFGKHSSCPPSELPRRALPSGTLSGTLVSSRGSGRPSISEPLDRCPFGPPTVALPYTYIKPSTPPLHHFLHSPNCIGTCDCVATAALRGSWSLGARSNYWVQTLSVFFLNLRRRRMELNTFFTEDDCGSDSHSTGRGRGRGRVGRR
jgi:hypothetical protein